MKKILFLLILLTIAKSSFSQSDTAKLQGSFGKMVDSLTRVAIAEKPDTLKVNILNELSKLLHNAGFYTESMSDADEALVLAKELNYTKGVAGAYNNKGVIYVQQANYPEALKQYTIALELRKQIGNYEDIGYTYINMGNVYIQQGNYAEALKSYFAALKIGTRIKHLGIIANSYTSIGNVYAQQGNDAEALRNYFLSLDIWKTSDSHGTAIAYDNIGSVYAKQSNYTEALKNFGAAIQFGGSDKLLVASSYGNMGDVYERQGKYGDAIKSYLTALHTQEEMGYKYGIADSYIKLGGIYIELHKEQQANDYLNKGLMLAKENGSKEEIKEAYLTLSKLDSAIGNINASYAYFKLYSQIKDSLVNEESNKQISQIKIQYETDKKDEQIKTQNLQINSQSLNLQNKTLQNRILQTSIAISLMVIGIIGLLFYLFFLRNRRKRNEYEHMLTDLELTVLKTQLNPHFISNSLINIKEFIDQQPDKVDEFLSKFARLMRQVLEQNEKQLTSLKEKLETAELYMQIESFKLRYGFDYKINCDSSVDPEVFMVPPLILQPLIENAIWHGLTYKTERGYIDINIKFENDLLKFTIEDNGVGQELKMQNENTRPSEKHSFGLSITNKRIELLNKEFRGQGYFNLTFLKGQTIAEVALPSIQL